MHSQDRPSVVFAVNGLAGGGAERVVVTLANHCNEPELETVLVVGDDSGPYRSEIKPHVRVIVHDLSLTVTNTLAFARTMRARFRGHGVRAVVSHLDQMNRMMMRARMLRAFDAPVIVVEQCDVRHAFSNRGHGRLEGLIFRKEIPWLYRAAHAVVGVSQGVTESIVGHLRLPKSHVHTIYNPVDLDVVKAAAKLRPADSFSERFDALPKPVFLAVGRLVPQKAFHNLIAAFQRLPAERRGSLVILGEGELDRELRSLAERLGVGDQVHLPGFVRNPWWYMARCDQFVLSSAFEGFGLVIVEALAAGALVVSTDCPSGPSEIVTDRENGRLVPVDDVERLAQAMADTLSLSSDEAMLQRARGLASIERFRPGAILSEYLGLSLVNGQTRELGARRSSERLPDDAARRGGA